MPSDFDYTDIDGVFHSRIRIAAVSVLVSVGEADFTFIRDAIGTTDGNLATHMRKLEEAGYVEVSKSFVKRKPLTQYRLSEKGRNALHDYIERLEKLLHP
jgi:DNA-binding transcriptional ArsR family regulator